MATNHLPLLPGLALAGLGLSLGGGEVIRSHIERGQLIPVLEEFSPPFPGFYLYYPQRRHTSPALRALIEYLLRVRRT